MKVASQIRTSLLLCLATGALSACNWIGSDDPKPTPNPPAESSAQISGSAVKGILKDARVRVYKLASDATVGEALTTQPEIVTTDASGQFSLQIMEAYQGPVLIEVTSVDGTMMACDVVDGCSDTVAFGDDYALESGVSLSAVTMVTLAEGEDEASVTGHVSILTEIAAKLLEEAMAAAPNQNLAAMIAAVNLKVAEIFQLGEGIDVSELALIDITDVDSIESIDELEAYQAALLSSAIAAKAFASSDFNLFLTTATDDIATNMGTLKVRSTETGDAQILTLKETVERIQDLNDRLAELLIAKVNRSAMTDAEKQAALAKISSVFQNKVELSQAVNSIVAQTILEINELIDQGQADGRSGNEFNPSDIGEPMDGPILVGRLLVDNKTVEEDGSVTFNPMANDTLRIKNGSDSDSLALVSVSQPQNGQATIVGDQISYSPNPDFNGDDSFTYSVSGLNQTRTEKVNISVTAIRDTLDADITMNEDDTDSRGTGSHAADAIDSIVITTAPQNGQAMVNSDQTIEYTPDADFNGTDSLVYQVTLKNTGEVETGTFNYTVTAVKDAIDDSLTTQQYVQKSLDLIANDKFSGAIKKVELVDGDTLVSQLTTAKASVSITNDGVLTYSPIDQAVGQDSVKYQVTTDSDIVEEALLSVVVESNTVTNQARAMIEDVRTWGAYLLPDDFDLPRDLAQDTEDLFETLDAAAPVFENQLGDIKMTGDVVNLLNQIFTDIDEGNTEKRSFSSSDIAQYDDSISGTIEINELANDQASFAVDLVQSGVTLIGEAVIQLAQEKPEDITRTLMATLNVELDAGSTAIRLQDASIEVTTAGPMHAIEAEHEVLKHDITATLELFQDVVPGELNESVQFDGQLDMRIVKGRPVTLEDKEGDQMEMDLYLPSNLTASGLFTVNAQETFAANLALTIANAATHQLPEPIIVNDLDELDIDYKVEDDTNWLNLSASISFLVDPSARAQGTITVLSTRTGLETVTLQAQLDDTNSQLVLYFDSDDEHLVKIHNSFSNGNGLVLNYDENGLYPDADSDSDSLIVGEIRDQNDANKLLATLEKQDDLVVVYYTDTQLFETLY